MTKHQEKQFADTNLPFAEMEQGTAVDKTAVAMSFSRAAQTYDQVAKVQQWVVARLLQQIDFGNHIASVLDVGCGTGHLTQQLLQRHRPKVIHGLDIADGMLVVAREKAQHLTGQSFVCGDAESLPFADNYFDLIVSSFALQWCPDFTAVLTEIERVLKPGGCCYFAIPAQHTLRELKACWYRVDSQNTHVNSFYQCDELAQLAALQNFESVAFSTETITEYYPDLKAITGALKAMGAHNVTAGRAKQLTGKTKIKKLVNEYEAFRTTQGLPVTWNVMFACLKK